MKLTAKELQDLRAAYYTPRKLAQVERRRDEILDRLREVDNWKMPDERLKLDIAFNLVKALYEAEITIEKLVTMTWEEVVVVKNLGWTRTQRIVQALNKAGYKHTICRPELRD